MPNVDKSSRSHGGPHNPTKSLVELRKKDEACESPPKRNFKPEKVPEHTSTIGTFVLAPPEPTRACATCAMRISRALEFTSDGKKEKKKEKNITRQFHLGQYHPRNIETRSRGWTGKYVSIATIEVARGRGDPVDQRIPVRNLCFCPRPRVRQQLSHPQGWRATSYCSLATCSCLAHFSFPLRLGAREESLVEIIC